MEVSIDVIKGQRFRMLDYPSRKNYHNQMFTPREIECCLSFKGAAQHFAATFAGKEAIYKVINSRANDRLREIEIGRKGIKDALWISPSAS